VSPRFKERTKCPPLFNVSLNMLRFSQILRLINTTTIHSKIND
jgi:hypothetical protein